MQHLPGNQLASRCHLLQAIHQILFSCSSGPATTHPDPWHARHPVTHHLQHLLHLSLAWSTRQSYHTGIKHFIWFCRTQHVRPLRATSLTATYFVTALHKQGMAPATIHLYLSAVSACHQDNGFADPCKDNSLLTLVKRGVTRSSRRLPDQCHPITHTILRHLICHLKSDQHLGKPDRAKLSAAFCVAFHGLLRVSEYTSPSDKAFIPRLHATHSDIQWHSQHFTLFLKRSDQQGKGSTSASSPSRQSSG